jgi:hypothetical protein
MAVVPDQVTPDLVAGDASADTVVEAARADRHRRRRDLLERQVLDENAEAARQGDGHGGLLVGASDPTGPRRSRRRRLVLLQALRTRVDYSGA